MQNQIPRYPVREGELPFTRKPQNFNSIGRVASIPSAVVHSKLLPVYIIIVKVHTQLSPFFEEYLKRHAGSASRAMAKRFSTSDTALSHASGSRTGGVALVGFSEHA
jgi:hypothetical protein